MNTRIIFISFWCFFVSLVSASELPRWEMVKDRSTLQFIFTQAGVDESGQFEDFKTELVFAPDQLLNSIIRAEMVMASVVTEDSERDEILRSKDMFAVKDWPTATFYADNIRQVAEDAYVADGMLTIRSTKKSIPFPFSLEVFQEQGKSYFRLQSAIEIKRLDFGVGKGEWAETTWISDEVAVEVDITAEQVRR